MRSLAPFIALSAVALVCGASIAWNVVLFSRLLDQPKQQERQVIVSSIEGIRRSGLIEENDPTARTITVRYPADNGQGESLMRVVVGGNSPILRVFATKDRDIIVAVRVEQIDQEALQIGEPVYLVTAPTKADEQLIASSVLVGDVLPRQ